MFFSRGTVSDGKTSGRLLILYFVLILGALLGASILTFGSGDWSASNGLAQLRSITLPDEDEAASQDQDPALTQAGNRAFVAAPGAAITGGDQLAGDGSNVEQAPDSLGLGAGFSSPIAGLDFDLADDGGLGSDIVPLSDGQIEVQKPLLSSGASIGSLTVTIDRNARLFVDKSHLRGLLDQAEIPATGLARLGSDQLVSFDRLRDVGVNLRYDPIYDHIEVIN